MSNFIQIIISNNFKFRQRAGDQNKFQFLLPSRCCSTVGHTLVCENLDQYLLGCAYIGLLLLLLLNCKIAIMVNFIPRRIISHNTTIHPPPHLPNDNNLVAKTYGGHFFCSPYLPIMLFIFHFCS